MLIKDVVNLKIPHEFGCDENSEETDVMYAVFKQLDDDVVTKWGCSKFVILFDNEPDFVVKIPFSGMYYYKDDDYEDDGKDLFFEEFYDETDYCALEASLYQDALVAGVEQFFTNTTYAGATKNRYPYYISEKAYTYYTGEKTPSQNSIDKARSKKSELDIYWLALAIDYYGEDAINKLLDFIDEKEISDLHNSNIGFRADGAPVIIDYSGFNT